MIIELFTFISSRTWGVYMTCIPHPTCRSPRTTQGGQFLPSTFSGQGLSSFCSCTSYSRLTGPWASRQFSCLCLPAPWRSAWITELSGRLGFYLLSCLHGPKVEHFALLMAFYLVWALETKAGASCRLWHVLPWALSLALQICSYVLFMWTFWGCFSISQLY